MLPRMDGIEVCKRLRVAGAQAPIIMLTAKDAVEDRITGLESGADDYLIKPFSLKELEARILAILRRGRQAEHVLHYGDLALDRSKHLASRGNVELKLTPTGFRILDALLAAAPAPVRRQELESMIWGDSAPDGSALRNHIHPEDELLIALKLLYPGPEFHLEPAARKTKIALRVSNEVTIWITGRMGAALGSKELAITVFRNLLENAIRHGNGGIRIELGEGQIRIVNQGDFAPKSYGNPGFGLQIARRACERMGWDLTLLPDVNETCFIITLARADKP